MTDPIHLVSNTWRDLAFDYNMITPGEPFPDLDGMTLAVDVETMPVKHLKNAGLSAFHGALLGVSVGCPELQKCWYVPLRHRAPGSQLYNVAVEPTIAWLGSIMSKAKLLLNQNFKFDAKFLATAGLPATTYDNVPLYDTLVATVLTDERVEAGLKPTANRVLGMPPDEEDAIKPYIVGSKDFQDWSYIPADLMAPYGCGDVERAIRLAGAQRAMLAREEVEDLMRLEMQVMRDLIHMELRGHRVDVPLLQQDLPNLIADEIHIARRIEQLVGASVNYTSPPELAEMFVARLGLPILMHKPGKNRQGDPIQTPVFDDAVLQSYARYYPQHAELIFLIRAARRLEHVKNFARSYLELQVDAVVHTTIKQVEARTGRESSEMPNLQQITGEELWDDPRSAADREEMRSISRTAPDGRWIAPGCERYFIAREGHTILSFDYSQVEYRFFAHYLNDERLLTAYRNDATLDMHDWTAKEILAGLLERDDAKSANFGIVFGMGDKKLVKYMATNGKGITEQDAKIALDKYYDSMPLEELQNDVGRALVRRGFVRTILNRRRRVTLGGPRRWGQARDKKKERGLEPYQALNSICQGGAVDLLKHRSVEARRRIRDFDGELILKVHDDVKTEVPTSCAEEAAREIKPILETFVKPDGTPYLKLPIYVKCTATQTSWYDAKKLELN